MVDLARRDLAARCVTVLTAGGSPEPLEFAALRAEIATYVRGVWPSIASEALDDVVSEAVARTIAHRERILPLDQVAARGYVMRVARNLYIDQLRSARESLVRVEMDQIEDQALDDDEILRLVDRSATLDEVRTALHRLRESGDLTAVASVVQWLNRAARGGDPSARELSTDLDVAHTTVSHALARFREEILRARRNED